MDQIAQGGGYQGLSVSYDVVTDNEHWFTLRVNAVRTQGSSDEMLRYYHINKDTGKVATVHPVPGGQRLCGGAVPAGEGLAEGAGGRLFSTRNLPPLTGTELLLGRGRISGAGL